MAYTSIEMTVTGGAEIERRLSGLERKVGRKIVRKAVREGAKRVQRQAKTNVRAMVGGTMGKLVARALIVRAFKRKKRGEYGVTVRIRDDDRLVHQSPGGRRAYIPMAIEYGHVGPGKGAGRALAAKRLGGGASAKAAKAIPFMRNAFDQTDRMAARVIERELWQGIKAAAVRG